MISGKTIKILGFGKYVPKKILSTDLEKKYGLPLGWSEKYSGVQSRHHVTFESNAYMGARAIENVLEKCNVKLKDIDLIISAGATFDYVLPNQSSVIKSELKDSASIHIPTIDIDSTCLSFVSSFEIASSLLDGKQYKNIIIASSEISSKGLDPENWETLTLFGDGAVAAILQFDPNSDSRFIKGLQKTYSEGVEYAIIKGGGNKYFFKDFPYKPQLYSFSMNGKRLLRLVKKQLPPFITEFFNVLPLTLYETDVIVPHQASKIGISILMDLYNLKKNQVKGNLNNHGNCIAASIPLTFHDAIESGEIKRGDICFLVGTSAGVSIGGILIKY